MSSDFSGAEGRGYADDDINNPSSSLVAFTGYGAGASPSGNSSDLLVDSDVPEEVAIHVDSTGAWDGKPRAWPVVPGYTGLLMGTQADTCGFPLFLPCAASSDQALGFLRTIGNRHLLTLFNSSYKDFKGHFFKVVPLETGYQSFCFPNKETKFPFYWTTNPKKVISWPKPQMTPEDLDLINQLCQLPPKFSCRALIGFLGNNDLPSNVFGLLSPDSWVAKRIHFDLFAEEKALELCRSNPLNLGLRSSLEACPKTKVRVHKRNLPHSLGLGLRSSLKACPKTNVRVHKRNLPHPLGLGLRSSLEVCPKTKVRVHKRNLSHPLGLGLRSSLEACPKIKVRVHKRNMPHPLGLGLRSSLEACPKTKVRVHKRNLPLPLGLGLRSSLEACPKIKVRVHKRNLPLPLGLGLRSSLEACPKIKVRVHKRNLPLPLGLGLRSSLEACPKIKVRVHKRNLPLPLGLGLRSSLEACPKTKVRVHKRNLPHPLGC
ncbi:hypothetical protein LR48_Vigan02g105800 [Vigna angularis]|uniref:Uncharacterized protein n=1 Tax=Phaseolus angularis TaxID=3914 RepID=A0A0L9TWE0_PHAAN|nr:hypothetical protein LR48_Vigan02g105800 [Vigna angularis]